MSTPGRDNPVNRALLDIIRAAAAKGESGPLDLDAQMEAAGVKRPLNGELRAHPAEPGRPTVRLSRLTGIRRI
jgi:hypothetical protein